MTKHQEQFEELMRRVRNACAAINETPPTKDQVLSVAVAVATTPSARESWDSMLEFVRERARIMPPVAPPLEADAADMVREVGLLLAAGVTIPGAPAVTEHLRDLHAKLAPRARKVG